MANLKINWLIGSITAIILLFGAFIVVNAMEKSKEIEQTTTLKKTMVFHYASEDTSPGAFANPSNWQPGNSSLPCGTGDQKPCEKEAVDEDELESILSNRTNESILEDPTFSTRN